MWCPANFEAASEHKDSKFDTVCLGSWACSFEMTLIGEHHCMVGNAIRCRRLKEPFEILYFGPAQSRGPQELVAQRRENGRFSSTSLPMSYRVCLRLSCREVHSRTMLAQSLMLVMHQRIRSIQINISRVTSLHLEPLRQTPFRSDVSFFKFQFQF